MQQTVVAIVTQTVICLALALTIWRFSRALPLQNVSACVTVIITASTLFELFAARTGFPSGPFIFTENLGYSIVRAFRLQTTPGSLALPWPVPLIWVTVLLNSRGIARLMLKPWRNSPSYGFWQLTIACVLIEVFFLVLEPFAFINRWWIWLTPKGTPSWYDAPWAHFAASALGSVFLLVFITPWLINKKPVKEPLPDVYPLWIWVFLMLLLAVGNAIHHLWLPAIGGLAIAAVVTFLSVRKSTMADRA